MLNVAKEEARARIQKEKRQKNFSSKDIYARAIRNDQIVIQFETSTQVLPPEGVITR